MAAATFWRSLICSLWLVSALSVSAAAVEKVRVPSLGDGQDKDHATLLDAYLLRPAGAEPSPAILILHGCGGLVHGDGSLSPRELEWANLFVARGYVALLLDSFTGRDAGITCPRGLPKVTPQDERPRDAYGALAWLQAQSFVRPDRIGVIGWSHGGATVMYTIEQQSVGRPSHLPGDDFRAAVAFYPGWCRDVAHHGGWRTDIPLLLLLGEKDTWTPASPCKRFAEGAMERGSPIDIHVYPGAYHDFDWPDLPVSARVNFGDGPRGTQAITGTEPAARADALSRVPAFFDRYLKN